MTIVEPSVALLFAAVFGLAAGSFLNVLIFRTHQELSPWKGRSKCLTCGHQLAWYDNVPLVSFSWLRGKCRYCRVTLSWQYPLVELMTALLFLLVVAHFAMNWWLVLAFLVAMLFIAIAVYDWRWSLLPDSFSFALAFAGAVFSLSMGLHWMDLLFGGVLGVSFFGAQYMLSRGRWVGSGDIFLGGALGLLLGWRMLGLGLLLAYFIGAIVASVLLVIRKEKMGNAIPFGPFLVAGGFLAWLWGEQIVNWYYVHALFR